MPDDIKIDIKVILNIGGKTTELTWKQAKELREKLIAILGEGDLEISPSIHIAS